VASFLLGGMSVIPADKQATVIEWSGKKLIWLRRTSEGLDCARFPVVAASCADLWTYYTPSLLLFEEKQGLDLCLGYSPLMSYLLTSFGATEAYARGAYLLSEALRFTVSATEVQRNTKAVGERIVDNSHQLISAHKAKQESELMVVEVDGIISPQILEKQGIVGRESLKQPTD